MAWQDRDMVIAPGHCEPIRKGRAEICVGSGRGQKELRAERYLWCAKLRCQPHSIPGLSLFPDPGHQIALFWHEGYRQWGFVPSFSEAVQSASPAEGVCGGDRGSGVATHHSFGPQEIVDWFNALRAARFHYLQVAFPGASDADVSGWPRCTRWVGGWGGSHPGWVIGLTSSIATGLQKCTRVGCMQVFNLGLAPSERGMPCWAHSLGDNTGWASLPSIYLFCPSWCQSSLGTT